MIESIRNLIPISTVAGDASVYEALKTNTQNAILVFRTAGNCVIEFSSGERMTITGKAGETYRLHPDKIIKTGTTATVAMGY